MLKPFSLLFFIVVLTWVVRIFLTTDGSVRIERACEPVEIFGKVSVSATALVADQFTDEMQVTMNQWVYGCRYMVWRSVYEEEYLLYLKELETQQAQDAMASETANTATGKPQGAKDGKSNSSDTKKTQADEKL